MPFLAYENLDLTTHPRYFDTMMFHMKYRDIGEIDLLRLKFFLYCLLANKQAQFALKECIIPEVLILVVPLTTDK